MALNYRDLRATGHLERGAALSPLFMRGFNGQFFKVTRAKNLRRRPREKYLCIRGSNRELKVPRREQLRIRDFLNTEYCSGVNQRH